MIQPSNLYIIKLAEKHLAMLEEQLAELKKKEPELKVGDWVKMQDSNEIYRIKRFGKNVTITSISTASYLKERNVLSRTLTRDIETRSAINWLSWDELQSLELDKDTQILNRPKNGNVFLVTNLCGLGGSHLVEYAVLDHL